MGRRGPPLKPTKLKVLRGNPGKRRLPGDANLPPSVPTCPEWLSPRAKTLRTRIVKGLTKLGVLNELDREKLAFMSQALDEAYDLEVQIIELRRNDMLNERDADGYRVKPGIVIYSAKGFAMPNPLLKIRNDAVARFHKMASEFGMSPADRATLLRGGAEQTPENPLAAFLAKKA